MLSTRLTKSLLHTTDNYIKALEKAGILTVGDLLNHYPRDYEDRTNVLDSFSLINIKEKNTILVKLLSLDSKKTANNKLLTKGVLEDKNSFMCEAVWFNRKYLATQLIPYKGKKVLVSGKVKYDYGKLTFMSPEVETDLSKISGEIVPIYSDINYIPTKWIAPKMELLKTYINEIEEDLPEEIIKKYDFISKKEAVYKIHFPKNKNDIELAQYRLAYGELFLINYDAISKKNEGFKLSEGKSIALKMNIQLIKDIISNIGFELTDKQKIVLFQILKDMEKSHSMQRLLEGDVGTGKTIVALIVAIHGILESRNSPQYNSEESPHPNPLPLGEVRGGPDGIELGEVRRGARGDVLLVESNNSINRIQVSFMAPTEILARQHFQGIQELLSKYQISSHLLVGSLTKKQKDAVKADIKSGNIDLVVGTHALVQEDVIFNNLGFVIVDEQHRFGVKQREVLEKGFGNKSGLIPHNLNMTATPIPRTLALTLYGDQDLSVIDEYPKGRKKIFTKVVKNQSERNQVELFVRTQIEKQRQVFWISPLVEESEKIDLANAIATYESLVDIFSPFKIGLLHGKMKAREKEQVMKEFSENKIQILSSTSVVEVGVDIPNATIICIEGSERFGLSQLHQFRGRVGRGEHQSYCYLFPSKGNYTDRLKAMEQTNNGFELAEIDLELRGPGEVYGVKQSGIPDLKVANLKDLSLISEIREDIEELFNKK